MRIMFQPDALHHQAPSNHTRHHHTLSGPPEKTSGFNIPNAPTASLHAARCTLHAARAAYNHKAAVVGEIIASSIKTRYRIAPFPTQTPGPPFFTHLPPTPHTFAALHPQPRSRIRVAALTHPPARHPIQRHNEYKPLPPHLPRHTSLATPPSPHLPRHISPGRISPGHIHPAPPPSQNHPRPHPCAELHRPRPTRIQHFLHMLPTQPH